MFHLYKKRDFESKSVVKMRERGEREVSGLRELVGKAVWEELHAI
jgi:hypothetical protein